MNEKLKSQIVYQVKIKDLIEKGPSSDKQKKRAKQYMAFLSKELEDVTRAINTLKLDGGK